MAGLLSRHCAKNAVGCANPDAPLFERLLVSEDNGASRTPPPTHRCLDDVLVGATCGRPPSNAPTATPLVVPQLAGHDSSWYLLCTSRPIKPLIYQQRKKAQLVSKTAETDENVFMSKKFLYGADSRGNAGFGFWQMAYGSDGSVSN